MNVFIHEKKGEAEDEVIINCSRVTPEIQSIINYIHQFTNSIEVFQGQERFQVLLKDIYYIDSVDGKTFIYCESSMYESREALKKLEEILCDTTFVRISKNCLLNVSFLKSVRPIVNHRLEARLKNDERVIISRKYIEDLKEKLKRGDKA